MFETMDRAQLLCEPVAAKILGIKPRTLRNRRKHMCGPTYIQIGRVIRYRLDDLEDYIKRHEVSVR
jgi:Helix-turn-helix domain